MIFKVGDKVVERKSRHFNKRVGTVKETHKFPFRVWNVTYQGCKGFHEYHKGELSKYKP